MIDFDCGQIGGVATTVNLNGKHNGVLRGLSEIGRGQSVNFGRFAGLNLSTVLMKRIILCEPYSYSARLLLV